jgi:Flp pilus assembly protein TadD
MLRPRAPHSALALLLAVAPASLRAQALAPKRALTLPAVGACLTQTPPNTTARRDEPGARAAAAQGRELALVGDRVGAAAAFSRATALDPATASYAYDLGRSAEEAGDRARAVSAYCGYLALAPNGAQAPEVRSRLAALPGGAPAPSEAAVRANFARGVAALDARRLTEAVTAFDAVLRAVPGAPEARYDRGLALLAQGRDAEATRDLSAYVASPAAGADRADVLRAVQALQQPVRSPGGAALRGALVPGLGQIYTGRPLVGAAVLTGFVSAVAVALQQRTVQRTGSFVDPFGNPYTATVVERERPYQASGIAAAGAIWAIGSLEGAIHASRNQRERPRLVLRATGALLPGQDGQSHPGMRVGVRLAVGG